MALVPTRPFTFLQLLRSQLLLLLLVLGLLTGTMIVPLLSSMSLAHFNNRLSRAASLFTTFAFHTHTTTYCGFNLACIVRNVATMMTIILAVPTSVCPPRRDHRVPGRAGGQRKAGGPVEVAHLASNKTSNVRLLVLYCGVGICGGSFDCFHWQFPYICLYECEIKRKTLLAKNSLFPRSARTTSREENGQK